MAIDTDAKRSSALDHEEPWQFGIPLPIAVSTQADWQHLLHSYSGILATTAAPVGIGERRALRVSKRETLSSGRRQTHAIPPDADLEAEG
jgi:hypothetical protein